MMCIYDIIKETIIFLNWKLDSWWWDQPWHLFRCFMIFLDFSEHLQFLHVVSFSIFLIYLTVFTHLFSNWSCNLLLFVHSSWTNRFSCMPSLRYLHVKWYFDLMCRAIWEGVIIFLQSQNINIFLMKRILFSY